MNTNKALSDRVSYRRLTHAAHYAYATPGYSGPIGHDMEEWDIVAPVRPSFGEKIDLGIPSDAEFHVGYFDAKQNHHWTFTRKATLSESAVCAHCRLRR